MERATKVAPVLQIINDELELRWGLPPWVRGGCHCGSLDKDIQVCTDDSGDIKRKSRVLIAHHHLTEEGGKVLVGGYN